MQNRTPRHGDVYRDEKGHIWLFVAEGNRHGRAYHEGQDPGDLEWRFVVTVPESRVYATRDHPADRPLPSRLELVVNAGAEDRIAELETQAAELKAERAALASAMKAAIGAVPPAVANHLREVYRQTRGAILSKGPT